MKIFVLQLVLLLVLISCDLRDYRKIEANTIDTEQNSDSTQDLSGSEFSQSSENDTCIITHTALMKTSMGDIEIVLYGKDAPETVANFIGLVKMNYYNGVLFHRIVPDFLIQAGDRNTLYESKKDIWGYGGESFYGGDIKDELNPNSSCYKRGYKKGVLAMANKGPNTNTSQFFICLDDAEQLEKRWTIFGRVIKGISVVDKISKVPLQIKDSTTNEGVPKKPLRILSIDVNLSENYRDN